MENGRGLFFTKTKHRINRYIPIYLDVYADRASSICCFSCLKISGIDFSSINNTSIYEWETVISFFLILFSSLFLSTVVMTINALPDLVSTDGSIYRPTSQKKEQEDKAGKEKKTILVYLFYIEKKW